MIDFLMTIALLAILLVGGIVIILHLGDFVIDMGRLIKESLIDLLKTKTNTQDKLIIIPILALLSAGILFLTFFGIVVAFLFSAMVQSTITSVVQ